MRPTEPPSLPPTENSPTEKRSSEEERLESLVDRLRATEVVSDDLAVAIAKNWKHAVYTGIGVLLCVWVVGQFVELTQAKKDEVADRFVRVQKTYQEILDNASSEPSSSEEGANADVAPKTPQEEELHQRKVAQFESQIKILEPGSDKGFYPSLGNLYLASHALSSMIKESSPENPSTTMGKGEEVAKALSSFNLDSFQKNVEKLDLVNELAALLRARALLVTSGSEDEAKKALTLLAQNARLVNVEALLILLRIAPSEDDKTKVRELAKEVMKSRPELTDQLTREFSRLGQTLS